MARERIRGRISPSQWGIGALSAGRVWFSSMSLLADLKHQLQVFNIALSVSHWAESPSRARQGSKTETSRIQLREVSVSTVKQL